MQEGKDAECKLRALREAKGLTQGQVAEALGVGQTAVSAWELGKATPPLPKLWALARLLGCTIEEMFPFEGKAEEPAQA